MRLLKKTLKWAAALFFCSTILAVAAYRYLPVWVTPLMLGRAVDRAVAGEGVGWRHTWVPIGEMSRHLPVAAMAAEDQRFLLHSGFDFGAIRSAAIRNSRGGKVYGASTITQQTVKNVFLWQGRSWVRKGLEAYFTVLVELMWSKQRIMECYLNSIEMGPAIYGAQAVAEQHFGKDAKDLTRAECALIAATLPNPLKYSSARPSGYMHMRQKQIEGQMRFIPSFPKEGEEYDPSTASGGVYRRNGK